MTVEDLEKQLTTTLSGMPNDLIEKFYTIRLKNNLVRGYASAQEHIKQLNPKSVQALKYIIEELLTFLKVNAASASVPEDPSQDGEGKNPSQKNGQEEEGEWAPPVDSIDDYSGGDFSPEAIEQFIKEKIKKTIGYLEDLLRRIKRCEERLDTQSVIIAELQEFKAQLPDMISAQVMKMIPEQQEQRQNAPRQGFFEMKAPSGEIHKVEGVFPAEWSRILQLATARENILLVGPTGCGKTKISEMLAEAIRLPYFSISCSEGMSENELKGWLLPLGEKGEWIYVPSDFITAYETGGVFCLDEMDASDPNVLTWLNKAIGGTSFNLAIRKGNTLVRKHKDFVLVGCANTMGAGADMVYVGRNQLDGATRDRFKAGIIAMDYSSEVEQAIIDEDVLMWGRYIRKALGQLQDQAHHMSTRTMISFTNMKRVHGWLNKDWEKSYFTDWSDADKIRIKNVIRDLIQADINEEQKGQRGK